MADVFVSYAREDKAWAEQIARGLADSGLEVFWDSEIPPGQTWADYIESKLSQSKALVVLWSRASTQSQWVREEARMGRDKNKLVPVMLDDAAPPFGFGEVQTADLSRWTGSGDDPAWQRFIGGVRAKVDQQGGPSGRGTARPPQFQPLPPRAAAPPPQPAYTAPPYGQQHAYAAPGGAVAQGGENLSLWGYFIKCLRLYVNGQGRARRKEYWSFFLFYVIACFIAGVIDGFAYASTGGYGEPTYIVTNLTVLALLAPLICVGIRRVHDLGWSGWLFFISFFAAFIPGQPHANQFGPDPKAP